MRTEFLWLDKAARHCDCQSLGILVPRPQDRWWGKSRNGKTEEEVVSLLARSLTGVHFNSPDLGDEYGAYSFEFTDPDWDPNVSILYTAPRIVEWIPELKRPLYLLKLDIVISQNFKRGQDEILAEMTIFAGVRHLDDKSLWFDFGLSRDSLCENPAEYETVWIYDSRYISKRFEKKEKASIDGAPRSMWGPLNLSDPEMRQYLPHRWLIKKELKCHND